MSAQVEEDPAAEPLPPVEDDDGDEGDEDPATTETGPSVEPVSTEPAEPPVDYEKAFNDLFAHAEQLQASVADLTHERDDLNATISDLESRLEATAGAMTGAQVLAGQLDVTTAELLALRARIAEIDRQRVELKLWATRGAGDKTDRMVLAEDGAQAAAKVPGIERLVLAASSLTW